MKGEHRSNSEVIFYQTDDGKSRLQVRFSGETAWLLLNQLADLFQRDNSISVGYRVKSHRGTQFRIWATH